MTNAIQLIQTAQGWSAAFSGPHAAEVTKLFNSNIIPTAFGPAASLAVVMTEVARRNPTAAVFHRAKKAA